MRRRRLAVLLAVACISNLPIGFAAADNEWLSYQNRITGLSFRYPPSLWVRERKTEEFPIPAVVAVIELLGRTDLDPDTIVLRFFVKDEHPKPGLRISGPPPRSLRDLRRGCVSWSYLVIDEHNSVVCVTCGRAACSWTVEMLYPRQCSIISMAPDRQIPATRGAERPHDDG